jgi:AAA family ATP:ADP antiporter
LRLVSHMLGRIEASLRVRREVARDALVGFAFLLVIIAGHVIVEASRDALFLMDLPASSLPWAYICIALLALGVARMSRDAALAFPRRRVLSWTSLLGSAVTAGFWFLCDQPRAGMVIALYVWTGLLATAITVQFWVVIGDRMGPGQAKRTFAFVAMGGLLGGVLGSSAATVVASVREPRDLLLCGAALFGCGGLLPELLTRLPEGTVRTIRRARNRTTRDALGDGYVRSLLALTLLTAVATTGIDFLFKSLAQRYVPHESLASFFASFYALVNLLGLAIQFVATRPLLQLLGPGGTLAALPSIGIVGAALTGLAGSLVPAAILKGADGALRHSLHRTSTEILFAPLSAGMRDPARSLAGSLGHRGGQAFGSILILGALLLDLDAPEVAVVLSVICVVWVALVLVVRFHYLERVVRRAGRRRY